MNNENQSVEIKDLFAALSKAQSEMTVAEKSADNPFHKSKYADLASVMSAARPHLTKHGLSVSQLPISKEDGYYLITVLGHNSGQWIRSVVKLMPKNMEIQVIASCLTYWRRYAYSSIVGIAAGIEDDDGEKAMERSAKPVRPESKVMPEYITANEVEIIEAMIDGDHDIFTKVLQMGKIDNLSKLEKSRYHALITWLEKEVAK